jgi:hypothetical protein
VGEHRLAALPGEPLRTPPSAGCRAAQPAEFARPVPARPVSAASPTASRRSTTSSSPTGAGLRAGASDPEISTAEPQVGQRPTPSAPASGRVVTHAGHRPSGRATRRPLTARLAVGPGGSDTDVTSTASRDHSTTKVARRAPWSSAEPLRERRPTGRQAPRVDGDTLERSTPSCRGARPAVSDEPPGSSDSEGSWYRQTTRSAAPARQIRPVNWFPPLVIVSSYPTVPTRIVPARRTPARTGSTPTAPNPTAPSPQSRTGDRVAHTTSRSLRTDPVWSDGQGPLEEERVGEAPFPGSRGFELRAGLQSARRFVAQR